jgi:hypothetical protein
MNWPMRGRTSRPVTAERMPAQTAAPRQRQHARHAKQAQNDPSAPGQSVPGMGWKIELVAIPVTDVDRARAFYVDQVGAPWR